MRTRSFWTTLLLGVTGALGGVLILSHLTARAAADGKTAAYTPKPKGALTFNKDIAPILLQNCASCHRPGEIGPFALQNYTDAKKRAMQLALVTQSHAMPPWHADSHGEFRNERKLTTDQIGEIQQWANEGAPEGDPADKPAMPNFPQGWMLGMPDAVLEMSRSYTMAAEGGDVYRCFVIPSNQTEDRYISAMEVRAGNTKIVHHVIAYLDKSGKTRELEAANKDGNAGYSVLGGIGVTPSGALGGWAPGNLPHLLPDGIGTLLPKGADVVLQVHYHADGKQETDRTRIGLYFCKKPVEKRLRILPVFAPLQIPAGKADYETVGKWFFPMPQNVSILEVMPHMHLLGHDMTVTATLPDKTAKTLVKVPNYDFNWQTTYEYRYAVKLPQGSEISLVAHYDNSTGNPRNPNNPPKAIHWGEQTTDEMCIAFVYFTYDQEHIDKGQPVTDLLDMVGGGLGGGGRLRRAAGRLNNP